MHEPIYCGHCGKTLEPKHALAGVGSMGTRRAEFEARSFYWCGHCEHAWPLPLEDRTEQLCEACDRFIPLGQSYCLYCGHHCAEAFVGTAGFDEAVQFGGEVDSQTPPRDIPTGRAAPLQAVARILTLIADPPQARVAPRAGDRPGSYAYWFDGGACRQHTGGVPAFEFDDGSTAENWSSDNRLHVALVMPDGAAVTVTQLRRT